MTVSLAALDQKIGAKRRELAEMVGQRDAAFQALDALGEAIDALQAVENPTDEQATELKAKLDSYKADNKAVIALGDSIRAAESDVADLQSQRAAREEHNRQSASLGMPAERKSTPEAPNASEANVRVGALTNEQMDHDISSFFRNSYLAKKNYMPLAAVCAGAVGQQYRNDRLHAAVTKSANPAMFPDGYIPRVIELLRPATTVRKMKGVRNLPLINGALRIPRQATGSSANYTGEMTNITTSDVTTEQITLAEKKLTVMVIQSGELMRQAGPNSDALIRDDIIAQLQIKEDSTFLRATGSATVPAGLKDFADDAGTDLVATPTVNIGNVTTDLGRLILQLQTANVGLRNPYFILAPRSVRYLMDARDSNGNYAFPEVMRGELRGYPFLMSNQIPTNLTVGAITDASEVYFVDASDLIIADAPTFELDVSVEAAYHDGTNVQAAFSQDAAVFRLIVGHDTAMRHGESVAYLTDVTWGV